MSGGTARGHSRIRRTKDGDRWRNRRGRGPSLPDLRSADEAQRMLRRIDAAARVADRRDATPRDPTPRDPAQGATRASTRLVQRPGTPAVPTTPPPRPRATQPPTADTLPTPSGPVCYVCRDPLPADTVWPPCCRPCLEAHARQTAAAQAAE